jgi:hypothetical protein
LLVLFPQPLNNLVFIFAAKGGAEVEAENLGHDGTENAQHVEHYFFGAVYQQVVAEDNDIEQHKGEHGAAYSQQGTYVFGEPRGVGACLHGCTALAGTVDVLQGVFLFFYVQSLVFQLVLQFGFFHFQLLLHDFAFGGYHFVEHIAHAVHQFAGSAGE